jgi:hypothetical protein
MGLVAAEPIPSDDLLRELLDTDELPLAELSPFPRRIRIPRSRRMLCSAIWPPFSSH